MSEQKTTDSRHRRYEQIKARELARGASEDEATRIATDTVDKVSPQDDAAK